MDRRIVREAIWKHQDAELEINITKRNGCYVSILKAVKGQLDAMLSYYSRVLTFRLDLHLVDYSGDNKKLSRMIGRLTEWLRNKYSTARVGYIWVREIEKAKSQHYHLMIMVDGRTIRHPSKVIEWIERYWQLRGEPKPYTPKSCYTIVKRCQPETYQKAFYRASYLAKSRGKGYKNPTANNYSTSRIKQKKKE